MTAGSLTARVGTICADSRNGRRCMRTRARRMFARPRVWRKASDAHASCVDTLQRETLASMCHFTAVRNKAFWVAGFLLVACGGRVEPGESGSTSSGGSAGSGTAGASMSGGTGGHSAGGSGGSSGTDTGGADPGGTTVGAGGTTIGSGGNAGGFTGGVGGSTVGAGGGFTGGVGGSTVGAGGGFTGGVGGSTVGAGGWTGGVGGSGGSVGGSGGASGGSDGGGCSVGGSGGVIQAPSAYGGSGSTSIGGSGGTRSSDYLEAGAPFDAGSDARGSGEAGTCPCTRRPGAAFSPQCPVGIGESTWAIIGPNGGIVALMGRQAIASGALTELVVPTRTLDAAVAVTIAETSIPPPKEYIDWSPVYEVGPACIKPAYVMRLRLPHSNRSGLDTNGLTVYYAKDRNSIFVPVPNSYVNAGFSEVGIAAAGLFFVGTPKPPEQAACP
jgi:hypothetical protein